MSRVVMRATLLVLGLVMGLGSTSLAADSKYDLVIQSGRVVDPESGLDAVRNIGLRDGKIAKISARKLLGARIMDASGLVVAPGFIDLHSHGQQLPAARMQAFDGVTTAVELESGALPVSEYYDRVGAEGRPINYGAAAGWGHARVAVMEGVNLKNNLEGIRKGFAGSKWTTTLADSKQLSEILAHVEEGLKEGALGVGFLLGYSPDSGRKEYYAVNKLAARYNVPTFTHIRHMSVLEPASSFEAYQEMVATAAATGARMHICHLNSTSLRDISAIVELISGAQKRGVALSVEAYPYTAGSTAIGSALFRGDAWRERMGGLTSADFEHLGAPLNDESFASLQKEAPGTPIVVHFMNPEKNPGDQDYLDISVLYPGGVIASDGMPWMLDGKRLEGDVWPLPEGTYAHPRSAGTFARFFRDYVRERQKLTLIEAIRKVSLIPAQILEPSAPQMRKKGRIQEGADADIVIFDANTFADQATFKNPAQTSVGIHYLIVNGILVIDKQELVLDALPGKAIRR